MQNIVFRSATSLARAIREREISAVELLQTYLRRISYLNPTLNAIVTVDEERVRRRAQEADDALARGELWGPLHGVPITVKDSFETEALRTTGSYEPLANYVPKQDATVVARLRQAGAIIIGKTNLSELARNVQTNSPLFGRTNNPWNLDYTTGGSSGGSAAAIAAGLSSLDVGSDFGGSIRVPAHFCGIFGLKPTEHRVSSAGHIPDLPGMPRAIRHMNVYGPLARSIDDLKLCLTLIAGPDMRDWEIPPVPLTNGADKALEDLRLAWTDIFPHLLTLSDTRSAIQSLAARLRGLGCDIVRSSPSQFDFLGAWQTYGEIVGTETGTNLPLIPRIVSLLLRPLLFRNEIIHSGLARGYRLSVQKYVNALSRRDRFISEIERFLTEYDAWICPVTSGTAFKHRRPAANRPGGWLEIDGRRIPYWMGNVGFTSIFSLTGNPVVVLPLTLSTKGLPIGIQLVGRRWHEMELLDIASRLVQVTGDFRPPSLN